MKEQATFLTSDFPLATFLFAKGVLLQGIIDSPDNTTRKVFVFIDPPPELLSLFQAGKAEINILALTNAQNTLRNMVRGMR